MKTLAFFVFAASMTCLSTAIPARAANTGLELHPQGAQIKVLLDRIDEASAGLNRSRLVAEFEVTMPGEAAPRSGVWIQWTFPGERPDTHFLAINLTDDAEVPQEELAAYALRRWKEQSDAVRHYLLNPQYAGVLERKDDAYFILETYSGDLWQMPAKDLLNGAYAAMPMDVSVRELLESPDTKIEAYSQSGSIARIRCRIDVRAERVEWKERFIGIWEAEIDPVSGTIVKQVAIRENDPQGHTKNEINVDLGPDKDVKEIRSVLRLGENLSRSIQKKARVLELTKNHDLSESVCYFSHYGLPEPPEPKVPGSYRTQPWLYYFVGGVLCVMVGAFLVHRVTRKSGRT